MRICIGLTSIVTGLKKQLRCLVGKVLVLLLQQLLLLLERHQMIGELINAVRQSLLIRGRGRGTARGRSTRARGPRGPRGPRGRTGSRSVIHWSIMNEM